MKKIFPVLLLAIIPAFLFTTNSCKNAAKPKSDSVKVAAVAADTINVLTAEEKAQGWVLLFDGKTLNGWKGYNKDSIPVRWLVKDGAIQTAGEAQKIKKDSELTGDIITKDQFDNFELCWEWKMTPQGNSGMIYHVVEGKNPETFATGPEYQMLDDKGWPEKLKDVQLTGSDYDMYPAHNANLKPLGEWNKSKIIVNGAKVEHWLNGTKVVEYELWSKDWKVRVKKSKWAEYPDYGLSKTGHIALQFHGAEVYFRAIKIKKL
jgi:hypothetical protein